MLKNYSFSAQDAKFILHAQKNPKKATPTTFSQVLKNYAFNFNESALCLIAPIF
jgi:hypothetical protein